MVPKWSRVLAPKEYKNTRILEYKSTRGKLSALETLPVGHKARGRILCIFISKGELSHDHVVVFLVHVVRELSPWCCNIWVTHPCHWPQEWRASLHMRLFFIARSLRCAKVTDPLPLSHKLNKLPPIINRFHNLCNRGRGKWKHSSIAPSYIESIIRNLKISIHTISDFVQLLPKCNQNVS